MIVVSVIFWAVLCTIVQWWAVLQATVVLGLGVFFFLLHGNGGIIDIKFAVFLYIRDTSPSKLLNGLSKIKYVTDNASRILVAITSGVPLIMYHGGDIVSVSHWLTNVVRVSLCI